ncbi:MAG: hypothetical protein K5894_07000, partial [Lachnospiraceae bacterium]|nr:hypothetical protein [Lachnospiraceae bacterium]
MSGPIPTQRQAFDRIRNMKLNLSEEHINNVTEMLKKMDEIKLTPDVGEQGSKRYAFGDLVNADHYLRIAISKGNPEEIIEKKRIYAEKRDGINELMILADKFNKKSIVGNMTSGRERSVPWVYSKDPHKSSAINGIFTFYSYIKKNYPKPEEFKKALEDFKKDPNAFFKKCYEKNSKKIRLGEYYKGKSLGEIAGCLNISEGDQGKYNNEVSIGQEDISLGRGLEAVYMTDPNEDNVAKNAADYSLMLKWLDVKSQFGRAEQQNPFENSKTRKNVLQLMSVVVPGDLDINEIFEAYPIDENGNPVKRIKLTDYINSKEDFDYQAIVDQSVNIIRDAMKVKDSRFDPVEFMENRQVALSSLLTKKYKDQGKPGYDLLEDEILNQDKFYESIRKAYPELKMPALTEEQKEKFKKQTEEYKKRKKLLSKKLSRAEKNTINRRKADIKAANSQNDRILEEIERSVKEGEKDFINEYNIKLEQLNLLNKNLSSDPGEAELKAYINNYAKRSEELILTGRRYKEWLFVKYLDGDISEEYCFKRLKEINDVDDYDKDGEYKKLTASEDKTKNLSEKTHLDRINLNRERRRLDHNDHIRPNPLEAARKSGMRNEIRKSLSGPSLREDVRNKITEFYNANENGWKKTNNNPDPLLEKFWNATSNSDDERLRDIHNALDEVKKLQDHLTDKTPQELERIYTNLETVVNKNINNNIEGIADLRESVNSLSKKAAEALGVGNMSFYQRFTPLGKVFEETLNISPVYIYEYNTEVGIDDIKKTELEAKNEKVIRLDGNAEEKLREYRNDPLTLRVLNIFGIPEEANENVGPAGDNVEKSPEEKRNSSLKALDSDRRRNMIFTALKASYAAIRINDILKELLGKERADELAKKYGTDMYGSQNSFNDLENLDAFTKDEQNILLSVMIGNLSYKEREKLKEIESSFVPVKDMGFNKTFDSDAENQENKIYQEQLEPCDKHDVIKGLFDNATFFWNPAKDGSRNDKTEYLSDLDFAENVLKGGKKEILDELKKVNGLHLQYQEEITEKIITENKANMKGIADTVPDAPSE